MHPHHILAVVPSSSHREPVALIAQGDGDIHILEVRHIIPQAVYDALLTHADAGARHLLLALRPVGSRDNLIVNTIVEVVEIHGDKLVVPETEPEILIGLETADSGKHNRVDPVVDHGNGVGDRARQLQ